MKKSFKILFAILLVSTLVCALAACNNQCADGHLYGPSQITTPATCTTEGVRTYTCLRCGETRTEAEPMLPHTPVLLDGTPATCKDAGLTDGIKCSVCNTVLTAQQAIQVLHHTWGNPVVTKAPSCTEKGVATQTCSVCGETSTLDIPPQHSWANPVVSVEPTCVQTGIRTETCSVCGETRNTVIALADHELKFVEETDTVAAHYHCDVCGQDFSDATGGNVVVDTSRIPVQDGFVTLWWTYTGNLPAYTSMWFTGGATSWGERSDKALEAQRLEGTNVYYVQLPLDKTVSDYNQYKITLGYNEASELPDSMIGINWDHASSKCTSANATFTWDGETQRVDLGTHSFASSMTDPTNLVLVSFVVKFDGTLPRGYNAYLMGTMNGWNESKPILLSVREDGQSYASEEMYVEKGAIEYKVVVYTGSKFSWSTQYGNGSNNATGTITKAGDFELFGGAEQSAPVVVTDENRYILVGSIAGWNVSQSNAKYIFTRIDSDTYKLNYTFAKDEEFKVKMNGESDWDKYQIGYTAAINSNTTFEGVDKVSNLFSNSGGNIAVKYACTTEITLHVASKKLEIKVTAVTVTHDPDNWIIVGDFSSWNNGSTASQYQFTWNEADQNYTITYTFKANAQFKIVKRGTWNGYDWNAVSSVIDKTYFKAASSDGNIQVSKACTVKITISGLDATSIKFEVQP